MSGPVDRWGASPADWYTFAYELGLAADLLPVVSNPHALIAPQSTLRALGKTPSRYNDSRKAVGIKAWTSHQSTDAEINLWSKERDYGLCIQTREVRALDFDIEDEGLALACRTTIFNVGLRAVRTRPGTVRFLAPFRLAGEFAKRSIVREGQGIIEFLATGQQFVAAGTHPSGQRYEWEGGCPSEFPTLESEAFEDLWRQLGGGAAGPASDQSGQLHRETIQGDDPVTQWLEQRGWVQGQGKRGELYIICPWGLTDHTVDTGPTATVYYPAGTGGYAQGHFKCLHGHCTGRTDLEFLEAIGAEEIAADDFAPEPDPVAVPSCELTAGVVAANRGVGPGVLTSLGFSRTNAGYRPTLNNVVRALEVEGFWRRVGYDEFYGEVRWCYWQCALGCEDWRSLTHADTLDARLRLEASGFAAIGPDLIRDALYRVGFAHRFDSAQLALNLVRWDGVPRVDSFLQTYYGAVAGEYAVAVGRYLWSALAGRTLDPGCQADMVPILVSAGQGHGKTSSVRVLALLPDAYVTLDLSARDADLARRMRGRQVYELGELQGLHTRAKEAIKVFITERADTWTPKYQEITVSYPRRGVFVGTTDHDEILDDEAGERRWLPVRVGRVDVAGVAAIRAQLWSEGAVLFAQHGVMWKEAERLARSAHADFKFQDSWLQDVAQVVQEWQGDTPVTLRDVAHGLGLDPRQVTRATEMRLAKILTTLGYGKRRSMVGGVVRKVFWEKQ